MAFTELYVSGAGAGAHDGSSPANAFSWAEMLTDTASGSVRYNLVSGSISRTTSTDTFTTAGSATAPRHLRGYNSSIGDLQSQGRTAGGALITTNFPAITYTTGRVTFPEHMIVENITLTSAATAATVTTSNRVILRRVAIANTHATSSFSRCASGGTNHRAFALGCDFAITSTAGIAVNTAVSGLRLIRCLLSGGSSGTTLAQLDQDTYAILCMFRDSVNGCTFPGITGSVQSCSFRNLSGTYLDVSGTSPMVSIQNNVAWGSGGSSKWYNSTTSVRGNIQENNAIGNFGGSDTNEGDWPVYGEIALSSDPFVSSSDLQLNSVADGGELCKFASTAGFDLGAWQHQATGGGPLNRGILTGGAM